MPYNYRNRKLLKILTNYIVSKMSEEDKSLFLSEVNDVTPLKGAKKTDQYNPKLVQDKVKTTIKKVKSKQRDLPKVHQTEKHSERQHVALVTAFEKISYNQKGVRLQELAKLRKGEFSVEAELDLHGYTQDEAEQVIHEFVTDAYQNRLRFIRIIHGKGYNSKEQYPVIKNLVHQELRNLKVVVAFCSAPEKDGGTGAVNIFIKAH